MPQVLHDFARIAVPALADLCAVDLVDQPGSGPSRRVAVGARDAADKGLLRELGRVRSYAPGTAGDTGRVLDGGAPVLVPELPERGVQRYPDDPAAAALFERLRTPHPAAADVGQRARAARRPSLAHDRRPAVGGRREPRGRDRAVSAGLAAAALHHGLTDVAGDDADARTAALERAVAAVPPRSDAETVVDKVLAACLPEPLRDDVALLAVRLTH